MGAGEGEDGESIRPSVLSIEPEAEAEILEAYWYYEDREQGLGTEFRRAVEACLDVITRHPRAYATVHGEVRRALVRRFPYSIFYLMEERQLVVIACFHASRDPEEWRRRV